MSPTSEVTDNYISFCCIFSIISCMLYYFFLCQYCKISKGLPTKALQKRFRRASLLCCNFGKHFQNYNQKVQENLQAGVYKMCYRPPPPSPGRYSVIFMKNVFFAKKNLFLTKNAFFSGKPCLQKFPVRMP